MNKEDVFQSLKKLQCIDPSQGAKTGKYIENKLSNEENEDFSKHLAKCEKCSKIVFLSEYLNKFAETELTANGS